MLVTKFVACSHVNHLYTIQVMLAAFCKAKTDIYLLFLSSLSAVDTYCILFFAIYLFIYLFSFSLLTNFALGDRLTGSE